MSGSVLVVDDDAGIRHSLRLMLEDHGYEVRESPDGESALQEMATSPADVVVLDLMLPGMDGFECCRAMRRTSDVPILMVSARGDSHDVVAGLEAGADDYIRKPFDPPELAARLRALRRRFRPGSDEPTVLRAGDISVVPERGEVTVAGAPVSLTKTEFRMLCELAARPGWVLSRETLLERVWEYDYFADARIVDVHIGRIRAKIEEDTASPRRLITVRGIGYKLQP